MEKDTLWRKIKVSGIFSFIFPLFLFILGMVLSKNGFTGTVKNYEEGMARTVQYILFGIGTGIFFFCDGISDFFSRRFLKKSNKEAFSIYLLYVLSTLWLLNIISITGFLGFLICGNLSWLTVFVILNISIGIKYLPSHKRMQKLLGGITK